MDDYSCNAYMRELDIDVHRWLPSDILSDIGIVVDTAESRRLDVVEDIASRLASVLGGSTVQRTRHHAVPPSSVGMVNSLLCRYAPPSEAWQFSNNNGGMMMLGAAVPVPSFAPARQLPQLAHAGHAILPPARPSGGGGTGVFLPRTVAYNGTTSSRTTGGNFNGAGTKPPPPPRHSKQQQQSRPSRQHQRGEENESARRSRRQLHGLHAHTVSAGAGRPEQTPRRVVGANPTLYCAPASHYRCPLGWVY